MATSLRTRNVRQLKRRLTVAESATQNNVHFLHIGKNAGNQMGIIINQVNESVGYEWIVKHPHSIRITDLPHCAPYFFSIRHPVTRFRSAFYSRFRKGQPKIYSEWTEHEEFAFANFDHANELAEALFEPNARGRAATAAMKAVTHLSANQIDWFAEAGFTLYERPPVWIIRVEEFESDLAHLLNRLGAPSPAAISDDPLESHAFDYSGAVEIPKLGQNKVERWYSQDMAFYDMCVDWIARQT